MESWRAIFVITHIMNAASPVTRAAGHRVIKVAHFQGEDLLLKKWQAFGQQIDIAIMSIVNGYQIR